MKGIRKIFKDLASSRNRFHWRHADIDYFLSTKGKIIFECFESIQLEDIDKLAAMIKSRNLKNIGKIIVCVYDGVYMAIEDFEKLFNCILAAIPVDPGKTYVFAGWIDDEKTDAIGVSVKLVAVRSENKDSAIHFFSGHNFFPMLGLLENNLK